MKSFLKVLGLILFFVIVSLVAIPYLFKDEIVAKIQNEVDKNLDAHIGISDVSLSMFRSFPNLHIELNNITVVGKNEFEKDTLAHIGSFYTAVDIKSVVMGEQINIESLVLADSEFNALVLNSGKANWDIVKTNSTPSETQTDTTSSDFKVKFDDIRLENINLKFKDDTQKIFFEVEDFDLSVKGDFSSKQTNLKIISSCLGINVDYESNNYINSAKLTLDALLHADLENMIFTFKENALVFNGFQLGIDGSVAVKEDSYGLDLKMNSKKTEFKTLLAMIPVMYRKDLKDITTRGNIIFNASAKGDYKGDIFPSFNMKLKVENGDVKYANLKESVNDIAIDVSVNNPGGVLDKTVVDINKFHFSIANNPFDARVKLKNPISDPLIDGVFKGTLDFAKLKHAIPLDSLDIAGLVKADVQFKGQMSSIEKEKYEEFIAKGSVSLAKFEFKTPDLPKAVRIIHTELNFTPEYIKLNSFDARIGKSDFKMSGRISNYIAYALRGKVLKGDFSLDSKLIDLNEFMQEEKATPKNAKEKTETKEQILSVIEVPSNLDLKIKSNFAKLIYDKLPIENIRGLILVKNSVATLENLSMNMLKGSMVMNGKYSTVNKNVPSYNFGINIKDFDVKTSYYSLSIVKEMIPMALNCKGSISTNMSIKGNLDSHMEPIMKSLNGNGSLHSRELVVEKNKTFESLAKLLKNDKYRKITLSKFDVDFIIKNGNIEVPPCKLKLANNDCSFYGTQSVEGNMNFNLAMLLPKEDLGKDFTKYLDKLPGFDSIQLLDVGAKITGSVDSPKVNLDLSRVTKQAKEAAEKELKTKGKKELKKQVDKLKNKLFDLLN